MKNTKLPKSKARTAYGLLSEVCALITEEPKRYDQRTFLRRDFGPRAPDCGTVACVAGWVHTLKGLRNADAWTVLGLNADQAGELFASDAAKGTPQTRAHVRSGVAHIRKFQKKYAAQLKAKKV